MTNNTERIEELISLYSLGILEDDEFGELENYIRNDTGEIQKLINDNDLVTSLLFYSTESETPPEGLKNKLMQRIRLNKTLEKDKYEVSFWDRISPFWYGLSGATVAAVMLLLIFNFSVRENYNNQKDQLASVKQINEEQKEIIDALNSEILTKEQKIAELMQDDSLKTELVGFIENPSVVVVDIASLKSDINSLGRILFDLSRSNGIFCGINLPQTAPDKTYQLWAIIDSKPVSSGIFKVDEKGNGTLKLEKIADTKAIQQFAVTLEPAGGVPQPTGEMYLAGSFL